MLTTAHLAYGTYTSDAMISAELVFNCAYRKLRLVLQNLYQTPCNIVTWGPPPRWSFRGPRNGQASSGMAFGSFFLVWTGAFAIIHAMIVVMKVNKGPILAVLVSILAIIGAYLFLSLNSHGWESNRLLSIGIGGGLGWIMLLNVCGIIWRNNNKIIRSTKENAANGTAIPPQSATLARQGFLASRTNAFLSIPMLSFMAAASH